MQPKNKFQMLRLQGNLSVKAKKKTTADMPIIRVHNTPGPC